MILEFRFFQNNVSYIKFDKMDTRFMYSNWIHLKWDGKTKIPISWDWRDLRAVTHVKSQSTQFLLS